MPENVRDRDLVLPPNTFAFVLDSTKGKVSVYVGPYKNSLSNTDQLVIWNEGENRFVTVDDVSLAIQTFPKAGEGQYIVLADPAKSDPESYPPLGNANETIELDVGRKVIIAGPATFPLWPGQTATTINGHHLRHNQYLLVRVYEPEQAKENAERAVMAPQTSHEEGDEPPKKRKEPIHNPPPPPKVLGDTEFTMGQLIVIKGTDVSFYMPSTGVEVVPDTQGRFVRDAATLERLEYCILLDENGEKRYVQGPDVVFPEPTEQFITNADGERKSRAIELNEQSGLYIKVIAAYDNHRVGDELFITGKDHAIYFPRPEHLIITYGDQRKHHAIAIPAGEGRYVLNRNSGDVQLVKGPKMFLPDPRAQVIVRRILDPNIVEMMYPGNEEAKQVNLQYANEQVQVENALAGAEMASASSMMYSTPGSVPDVNVAMASSLAPDELMRSQRSRAAEQTLVSTTRRSTRYTPPRTVVLDTKYQGAVTANIWPGYAVLVMNKTGARRVEMGPVNLLLEYDEHLMQLGLSTGRPKNDHRLYRTTYLRTINNQVSDSVTIETKDLVSITLDLSFRVNFEAKNKEERIKWFDIENYVKVLTDHCRSRLRNAAKRHNIQEFYTNTIDIIRDTLLGEVKDGKREGLFFKENNMRLYDVEVLGVDIADPDVGRLLLDAMNQAVEGAIELSQEEDRTTRQARIEELARESLQEINKTRQAEMDLAKNDLQRLLEQRMKEAGDELKIVQAREKVAEHQRGVTKAEIEQRIALASKQDEVELARLTREVEQFVTRMGAIDGKLMEAMQMFGDKTFVEHLVQAIGPVALASGVATIDLLQQIFKGTPFEGITDSLAERPFAQGNGAIAEQVEAS